MDVKELKQILELHKKWLVGDESGTRADLRSANLSCADLSGTDLSGADLSGTDLSGADLSGADLSGADLSGADLRNAVLRNADLNGVIANETTVVFFLACPEEGAFIGYKKANEKIVVLEIQSDAKRSSATTLKCRCSKAKVLRIETLAGSISSLTEVPSDYDSKFFYRVGEIVEVPDFDEDRWNECSKGIHFFMNRQCAVNY